MLKLYNRWKLHEIHIPALPDKKLSVIHLGVSEKVPELFLFLFLIIKV